MCLLELQRADAPSPLNEALMCQRKCQIECRATSVGSSESVLILGIDWKLYNNVTEKAQQPKHIHTDSQRDLQYVQVGT